MGQHPRGSGRGDERPAGPPQPPAAAVTRQDGASPAAPPAAGAPPTAPSPVVPPPRRPARRDRTANGRMHAAASGPDVASAPSGDAAGPSGGPPVPGPGVWFASTARQPAVPPAPPPPDVDPRAIRDRERGLAPDGGPRGDLAADRALPRRDTVARAARGVARAGLAAVRRSPASGRALVISPRPGATPTTPCAPRRAAQARPVALAAIGVVLLLGLTVTGYVGRGGASQLALGLWSTGGGAHALPTPIGGFWQSPIPSDAPPAPSPTDPAHYVQAYGFDPPNLQGAGLSPAEVQRLADMLPFALAAAARWDARYGATVEPELLLFWTHAEGIDGRVSYSNCANESPPAGLSFFQHVANCDTPGFWQLGYGNQFSVIDVLKTAFIDMRGDPNDPQQVQRVGQAVLDWDMQQGTLPKCGGYSCTFPALTIDQIMAGVSLTQQTDDDWWASVLSRDPAINCYMLARALNWFNHDITRGWVGCYYAEPCWQGESNSLGDVLVSWPDLLHAARLG